MTKVNCEVNELVITPTSYTMTIEDSYRLIMAYTRRVVVNISQWSAMNIQAAFRPDESARKRRSTARQYWQAAAPPTMKT